MQRLDESISRGSIVVFACLVFGLMSVSGPEAAGTPAGRDLRTDVKEVVEAEIDGVHYSTWQHGGRRWSSVSLDGGDSWSVPRAMIDEIPLVAGVIIPGESVSVATKGLGSGSDSGVFLVQFEIQSLPALRQGLRNVGAEVLSYVPHNTHLVRMDSETRSRVEALDFVRWVGPYAPGYRAAPELLDDLGDSDSVTRRFRLQTFVPGPEEKALLEAEIRALGGIVVLSIPDGYIVEASLSDTQALALLSSDRVQWVDEWSAPQDDMDKGRVVAGADYVFATPGAFKGAGVRAEVMDGNVDVNHPDFAGIILHGPNSGSSSHGTPTYGINFGSGSGNAAATGMVPQAQGIFADYDNFGNRYTHTAELVDPTLEYQCVYQSNSWGYSQTTVYNSYSAEMDDIIWMYDIAIFQSQSNTGNQTSRPQAWAKNIISVGGARHVDTVATVDDYWSGASIGPASDGRVKPDLTFFYDWIFTTAPGGYRSDFGGTSGATPMAAGTSGLFFQMWAEAVWGPSFGSGTVFDKRPHFSTMKALLINTAEQYDWTTTNPSLTRFKQGWGYPNAQNAYDRAPMTVVIDESSVLQVLEKDHFLAFVPASQDALKVTMVYADRAAVPGAAIHRVNDVTLKVVAPDGAVYWGNSGMVDGLWTTSGGVPDTINTVENVFVENPAAGLWSIEVEAVEVNEDVHVETPEDDQDYAMVVYGVTSLVDVADALFLDDFEMGDTTAWEQSSP